MNKVKVILFSKDRPMQCDAAIRSFLANCTDHDQADVDVLYDYSTDEFRQAYLLLKNSYGDKKIVFVKQSDFNNDITASLTGYEYVLFLVDDNLFVKQFKVADACSFLNARSNVLVFSYRLGMNIAHCYPLNVQQNLPAHTINSDMMMFTWMDGEYDWNYPMDVSSSLYRVETIRRFLNYKFENPNQLEYFMDSKKVYCHNMPLMACYPQSVAFCNPINKVNRINQNRAGHNPDLSTTSLLKKFMNGERINIEKYIGMIPKSPHQEASVEFTR